MNVWQREQSTSWRRKEQMNYCLPIVFIIKRKLRFLQIKIAKRARRLKPPFDVTTAVFYRVTQQPKPLDWVLYKTTGDVWDLVASFANNLKRSTSLHDQRFKRQAALNKLSYRDRTYDIGFVRMLFLQAFAFLCFISATRKIIVANRNEKHETKTIILPMWGC